uniref:Uncharacterized protein n=1 Tax=Oryza barthii TaxID=65489 RepID=A0A0D3GPS1_9ORYZ
MECSDTADKTAMVAVPDLGPTRLGEKPREVVLEMGWATCRFLKAAAGGGARPPLLPPPPLSRCPPRGSSPVAEKGKRDRDEEG